MDWLAVDERVAVCEGVAGAEPVQLAVTCEADGVAVTE